MPADLPPTPPERHPIEIVPLDPPALHAAPPDAPPPTPAASPARGTARAFPHLVVDPIPTWPAPAVRTSRHPAATLLALAVAVPGVDLTVPLPLGPDAEEDDAAPDAARPARVVLDLVRLDDAADPEAAPVIDLTDDPAPEARPVREPSLLDAARLRALLAREREALAEAPAPAVAPDATPFPLPVARRTPKPAKDDVAPRALRSDVAAAMARATASLAAPAAPAAPTRARDRLELVPLGDAPAPVVDLRDAPAAAPAEPGYACPACTTRGVVDVIDQIVGEVHVSCPACFRMWRTPVQQAGAERR